MSTLKHHSFCSGPMDYKSVTELPGIGAVYGGRLNNAGYHTARDIYDKFNSFNFDSGRCQMWLNSVCQANSRYSSMCYEALRAWHNQFGERSYSPRRTEPQRAQHQYQPYTEHSTLEFELPTKINPVQRPERNLHLPVQQSPATSGGCNISKAEVMQMMAEFRKKQDAMATQINNLEQEKLRTDNYIRTLETKIEVDSKKTAELQKRQDAKFAELANKLRVMDRTVQYKNISSAIYLLNQKFDDILKELDEIKQKSAIHGYIKALETRIDQVERSATKLQKQQNEKISSLKKNINDTNSHVNRYKDVSSSINLLAQKFDEMIKQQSKSKKDKLSTQNLPDARLQQLEQDLRNLTVEICNVSKASTKKKDELRSEKPLIEKSNIRESRNKSEDNQPKVSLLTEAFKDGIVEQVESFNKEHDKKSSNVYA